MTQNMFGIQKSADSGKAFIQSATAQYFAAYSTAANNQPRTVPAGHCAEFAEEGYEDGRRPVTTLSSPDAKVHFVKTAPGRVLVTLFRHMLARGDARLPLEKRIQECQQGAQLLIDGAEPFEAFEACTIPPSDQEKEAFANALEAAVSPPPVVRSRHDRAEDPPTV